MGSDFDDFMAFELTHEDDWIDNLSYEKLQKAEKYGIDPYDYDSKSDFKEALRDAKEAHKAEKEEKRARKQAKRY